MILHAFFCEEGQKGVERAGFFRRPTSFDNTKKKHDVALILLLCSLGGYV